MRTHPPAWAGQGLAGMCAKQRADGALESARAQGGVRAVQQVTPNFTLSSSLSLPSGANSHVGRRWARLNPSVVAP